jgi:hypothetical protein
LSTLVEDPVRDREGDGAVPREGRVGRRALAGDSGGVAATEESLCQDGWVSSSQSGRIVSQRVGVHSAPTKRTGSARFAEDTLHSPHCFLQV